MLFLLWRVQVSSVKTGSLLQLKCYVRLRLVYGNLPPIIESQYVARVQPHRCLHLLDWLDLMSGLRGRVRTEWWTSSSHSCSSAPSRINSVTVPPHFNLSRARISQNLKLVQRQELVLFSAVQWWKHEHVWICTVWMWKSATRGKKCANDFWSRLWKPHQIP